MSEAKLRVFKSNIPASKYILKSGKEAKFVDGRFLTAIEGEIKEMEVEIAAGHPHLYIDNAEKEIDAKDALDPMAALKKKIIDDYLAGQPATVQLGDLGSTTAAPVVPASSSAVASERAGQAKIVPGLIKKG